MKKVISILLCLIMLGSFAFQSAFASTLPELAITAGNAKGYVGDTVTVPVTLSGTEKNPINSIYIEVSYDSNILELVTANPGSLITNPSVSFSYYNNSGTAVLLFSGESMGSSSINNDGVFANLSFKIKKAGISNVTLNNPIYLYDLPNSNPFNKKFTSGVIEGIPADTNPTKPELAITAGNAKGHVGDTVTVPITLSGSAKNPINDLDINVSYDNNILDLVTATPCDMVTNPSINFSYSNINGKIIILFADESMGSSPINKDGVFVNLSFKIKDVGISKVTPYDPQYCGDRYIEDPFTLKFTEGIVEGIPEDTNPTTPQLAVAAGNAKGYVGDTVTLPVTFSGTEKYPIYDVTFDVNYDKDALELVTVSPGNIVTNPSINFASSNNSGKVVLLFTDESMGNSPINKDGVFVNLSFKIKKVGSSKITFSKLTSFNELQGPVDIKYIEGVVEGIYKDSDSTISPTAIKVDKSAPTDVSVAVFPNGDNLAEIKNGSGTLVRGADYIVSGSLAVIKKSYLSYYFSKFPDQNLKLDFILNSGNSEKLCIYTGTSPLPAISLSYTSYVLGSNNDLSVKTELNGNFITSIKTKDNVSLVPRIDHTYSVTDKTIIIRKGFLNKYNKPIDLLINFTDGSSIPFKVIPQF
ncbi:MAG TPA: cohesin domain-containing protein [Clostridia bacterium]